MNKRVALIGYVVYFGVLFLLAFITPSLLPGVQLKLCECLENTIIEFVMFPASVVVAMIGVWLAVLLKKKHTTRFSLVVGLLFVLLVQTILLYLGLFFV